MQVFRNNNSVCHLCYCCRDVCCLCAYEATSVSLSGHTQYVPLHRDKKLLGPWLALSQGWCIGHLLPPRPGRPHLSSSAHHQTIHRGLRVCHGTRLRSGLTSLEQAWVASLVTPTSSWARGLPLGPFWSLQLLPEKLFLCYFIITIFFILANHFITHREQIQFILCLFLKCLFSFSTSFEPSSF